MKTMYSAILRWKRLPQLILALVFLIFTIRLMRGGLDMKLHVAPQTNKTNLASDMANNHQYRVQQPNISDNQVHRVNSSEFQVDQSNNKFTEIHHIAFLKVHKAASSTVQNIFYRFGLKRNLSIVLPIGGHYISKKNGKRNQVLPPYDNITGKHDILCNHVVFNYSKFKKLMYSDAVYIAIVREPLHLFISSALYYRYVWPNHYLTNIGEKNFIHDLMHKPEKYEPKT